MFSLTEVSFTIHKGWQSLIIANNVIAVWHGFIYTAISFFILVKYFKTCAVGGQESHSCFHSRDILHCLLFMIFVNPG